MAKKPKTIKVIPSPPFTGHPGHPAKRGTDCCPMVAAAKAAKRGKYRLARRYAAMSAGLLLNRMARCE